MTSMLLPGPGHLRAVADQLSAQAGALRDQAGLLAARASTAHWHSTAATRFQHVAQEVGRDVSHGADALDDLAAALRRHADRVEQHLAALGHLALRAAHDTVHAGALVGHAIEGGLTRAGNAVLDAVSW